MYWYSHTSLYSILNKRQYCPTSIKDETPATLQQSCGTPRAAAIVRLQSTLRILQHRSQKKLSNLIPASTCIACKRILSHLLSFCTNCNTPYLPSLPLLISLTRPPDPSPPLDSFPLLTQRNKGILPYTYLLYGVALHVVLSPIREPSFGEPIKM